MKIRNIIVPVDFSENSQSAAIYALWLADNHKAKVTLLHVVHPETGELDVPAISARGTMIRIEAADEAIKAFEANTLGKLEAMYKPRHPVDVKHKIQVGMPTNELMKFVRESDSDVIVMGTRGTHNRLDQVFGSITTSVLRKSDIPVFVIPLKVTSLGLRTVGYATDLNPADAMEIWRAGKIVEPCNPTLRVVHVSDKKTSPELDELKEFLGNKTSALQTTYHVVNGISIEEALMEFSEDFELDLLAFYAPKRNWFERLWHHSISGNLALFSATPLLSMR